MNLNILAQILSENNEYFVWVAQEKEAKMKFIGIQTISDKIGPLRFSDGIEINSLHEALELGEKMHNSQN